MPTRIRACRDARVIVDAHIHLCICGVHAPRERVLEKSALGAQDVGNANREKDERATNHVRSTPARSYTFASMNVFTSDESSRPSFISIFRMSNARSVGTARLYGRSLAVSAS